MARKKKTTATVVLVKCLRVCYTDDKGIGREVVLDADPWFSCECEDGKWSYFLRGFSYPKGEDVSIPAPRVMSMQNVQFEERHV